MRERKDGLLIKAGLSSMGLGKKEVFGTEKGAAKMRNVRKTRFLVVFLVAAMAASSSGLFAAPIDDAVSAWDFDEGSGTQYDDIAPAGNNNHATLNGAATWSSDTPASLGAGSEYSARFDGNGDYATDTSPSGLNFSGSFTVEGWIKINSWVNNQTNCIVGRSGGGEGWLVSIDGRPSTEGWRSHNLFFDTYGAGNSTFDLDAELDGDATGKWFHIAVVYDSTVGTYGERRVYFNASLKDSDSCTAAPTYGSGRALMIGGGAGLGHDGWLDEIIIYDEARTQTQIEYDRTHSIPEPATMALLLVGLPFALRRRK